MPGHRYTQAEAQAAGRKGAAVKAARKLALANSPKLPEPTQTPQLTPAPQLPTSSPDPRLALVEEEIDRTRDVLRGKVHPRDRANLLRGLCALVDRRRIMLGQPLPGSRKPGPTPTPRQEEAALPPPRPVNDDAPRIPTNHDTAPKESLSPNQPVPTVPTPTPQDSRPPSIYHPQDLSEERSGNGEVKGDKPGGVHLSGGPGTVYAVKGRPGRPGGPEVPPSTGSSPPEKEGGDRGGLGSESEGRTKVVRTGPVQEIKLPNGEVIRVRADRGVRGEVRAGKVVLGGGTKVP